MMHGPINITLKKEIYTSPPPPDFMAQPTVNFTATATVTVTFTFTEIITVSIISANQFISVFLMATEL
jgi:hypothetical protein